MGEIRITRVRVLDARFPTSLISIGSDAVNTDPDYSAAYCIVKTDVSYVDALHEHFLDPVRIVCGRYQLANAARI